MTILCRWERLRRMPLWIIVGVFLLIMEDWGVKKVAFWHKNYIK
jgi:hypothetical protein